MIKFNSSQSQVSKSNESLIFRIIMIGARFLLNYLRYHFLTGLVILTLVAILFIVINLNPNFSFGFFKYLSFINPVYKTGTFELNLKDIMYLFSIISLILLIATNLVKFFFEKLFAFKLEIKQKFKKLSLFVTLTTAYFFGILLVFIDESLELSLSLTLIIFYFIALINFAGYFTFGNLLKRL